MIKEGFSQDPNEEAQRFYELVKEVEQPLYPDCESTPTSLLWLS